MPTRAHTTPHSASIGLPGATVILALTALGMILAVAALPGTAGAGRQAVEIVATAGEKGKPCFASGTPSTRTRSSESRTRS